MGSFHLVGGRRECGLVDLAVLLLRLRGCAKIQIERFRRTCIILGAMAVHSLSNTSALQH